MCIRIESGQFDRLLPIAVNAMNAEAAFMSVGQLLKLSAWPGVDSAVHARVPALMTMREVCAPMRQMLFPFVMIVVGLSGRMTKDLLFELTQAFTPLSRLFALQPVLTEKINPLLTQAVHTGVMSVGKISRLIRAERLELSEQVATLK